MTVIKSFLTLKVTDIATGETRFVDDIFDINVPIGDLKQYCRRHFSNFLEVVNSETVEMDI